MKINVTANVTVDFECSGEELKMILEHDKFEDIFRAAKRAAEDSMESEIDKKRAEFQKEYEEMLRGWDVLENADQKKIEEE